MSKKILLTSLSILLLSPLPALAGFYAGGGIGTSWYGADIQTTNITDNLSENATAWKLFVGLSSDSWMCVEGGYRNLGSTDTTVNGQYFSFGTSGWDLEMLGRFKLGPAYVFGKLGGFTAETETNAGDDKSTGIMYGLGAALDLSGLGLRLEWEYLDVDVPDSLSMLTLGATFGF
jgi:hypothetical protein